MNGRTWMVACCVVMTSLVLVAGPIAAQARGPAALAAGADVALQDTLVRVDVAAGTVTLGGETLRVADDARLVDEAGARLRLSTLASRAEGREVLFRARESRRSRGRSSESMRVLVSLALMDGDFE